MLDEYKKSHTRTFAQRIGGPWSLSVQTFALNGLLSLIVLFSTLDIESYEISLIAKWLIVWFLSVTAVGIYLFLAGISVLRKRRKETVRVQVVIAVNFFIGIIYTFTSYLAQNYLGLVSKVHLGSSMIINVVFVLWWSITLSIFMDIASESKKQRSELIEAAIQNRVTELQESDIAFLLRQEISQEVSMQLEASKKSLDALIENLEYEVSKPDNVEERNWPKVAELLEKIARDSIRPLSKNLLKTDEVVYPKTTWGAIFKNMLRQQPFRPLTIVVIDLVGAAPASIHLFGFRRSFPLLVAVTILILGIGYFFNFLMRRYPSWHTHLFVAGMFAFEFSVVPLRVRFREEWIPGSASVQWAFWQFILGVIVIFMASGFSALRSVDVQTKALFSHELKEEFIIATARALELAKIAQESSRMLHGAVQSRLVSCAMVIERAAKSGDKKVFTAALQEAYEVLSTSLPTQILSESVAAEIDRKVALWRGLCEFKTEVTVEVSATTAQLSTVLGRIVEEAISNSIRHGKATSITIHVFSENENSVGIRVVDNGVGLTRKQPGMGTALIDQVTSGNWSLIRERDATKLTASISVK